MKRTGAGILSVAAMTTSRNEPVEMNCTRTYFGEIWCQTPPAMARRFSDRGSASRSNVPPSGSVAVDAGLESGVVSAGLFVIVVLPDGAQVLRDECGRHQQRTADGRRDHRRHRA